MILFSGIDVCIDTNNCIFFPQYLASFSKNWCKNSTKFPSKWLKICTKVFCISPQTSLKFQRNVSEFFHNKVIPIFTHNFPRNDQEFPWSFHEILLPNINILKTSTKSFKNFKTFLKISVMFSTVLPKKSLFWFLRYLLKCSWNYFKIFPFSSNIFSKFPDIFSEFSFNNFTNCF